MKWESVKLGDYCDITSSKRIFYSEYVNQGVPFFRSKEIIRRFYGVDIDEPLYISSSKYKDIKKRFGVPSENDLLLTSVGTIGIPYIVKSFDEFYFKDGNLTWFKDFNSELYSKFLYYWIISHDGIGIINSLTIGSSQKALTISALKGMKIPLPPLPTQKRIANILSNYDDLIENNKKQIKLLEEAAERLYKEWFISLRFPGHENVKIIDGVPRGWVKKKLYEITNINMGQSPKSEFYNCNAQGLPFHQGVTNYGDRFVNDETYCTKEIKIAIPYSILFSVRAPVGRINITRNKIIIGRGLAALNHKDDKQSFLFYLLRNYFYKDNLIGNGSIFASITKTQLENQEFLLPTDELIEHFNNIAKVTAQQLTS